MGYVLVAVGSRAPAPAWACSTCWMRLGQIDIFVSLAYVLFLGTVGAIMFAEPGHDLRSRRLAARLAPACTALLVHGWPLKTRFPTRGSTSACSSPLLMAPSAACSQRSWGLAAGS